MDSTKFRFKRIVQNTRIVSLSLLLAASLVSPLSLADTILKGIQEQGGLIVGKTEVGNTVYLNNEALTVSDKGDFVFGFGRDENKEQLLVIKTPSGKIEEQKIMPKKREYNIQRINGIKKSIMKPNPKAIERTQRDNAIIGAARKTNSDLLAFTQGFIAPINGKITGVYGSQRVFNGEKKRPHFGLDYAGKTGDPVMTPADGIILAYEPDMFYSGGTMIIDHGHGVTSTFLHLSASYVKIGDSVKQGDVVAAVGASGRATGPHLDWRINWFNVKIDPALVLKIKH